MKFFNDSTNSNSIALQGRWRRLVVCIISTHFLISHIGTSHGQQLPQNQTTVSFANDVLNTSLLKRIEARVLPPVISAGPARFSELPDYYWAENKELQKRLKLARHRFEKQADGSFRALTLIAGSAGVGKTFIKRGIFSRDYAAEDVCKFDVKELYDQWREKDLIEDRADLHCGPLVVCKLPAIKTGHSNLMRDYLASQSASFFVIDSLDEVHPDDYYPLLKQIEQFVLQSDRPFVHVVVLGRPPAFCSYWRSKVDAKTDETVSLYMLAPPRFLTTGDLQVSSWNYHTWRYKLRWQDNDESKVMPLESYSRWVQAGFPNALEGRQVEYQSNRNMDQAVFKTVQSWAQSYPVVNSMLANLAGNGMIREIAEEFAHQDLPYDERKVMETFLVKWLERDSHCENRPSCSNPEHLDLYMQLIEGVAAKYLREGGIDSEGYFHVEDGDMLEVDYQGQTMKFSVQRILDRSGLKYFDPRKSGDTAYRFEPIWLHRLLVQKHKESSNTN